MHLVVKSVEGKHGTMHWLGLMQSCADGVLFYYIFGYLLMDMYAISH